MIIMFILYFIFSNNYDFKKNIKFKQLILLCLYVIIIII